VIERFDWRLCIMLGLVLQTLWIGHAHAVGAIAVGVAPGGVQNGFTYAVSSGYSTEAEAEMNVLQKCRTTPQSNAASHSRCLLIGAFTNQCAAVAMDPKNGTPGAGWFIANDLATANRLALASCWTEPGRKLHIVPHEV
jgi:Domain of unknown function (DUF4189)